MALRDVLDLLRCPHCHGPLRRDADAVRCPRSHAFDVARQGYVNLLPGSARATTADTPAMVAARAAVVDAGTFATITEALTRAAAEAVGSPTAGGVRGAGAPAHRGAVIDVGAGTGHHLAAVLDRLPGRPGLALDVSKHALRRAARAHPRLGAVRADTWQPLPVRDAVAALVLCVFAPRNGPEIARVLRPGGAFVVVTPTPAHLAELVEPLGLVTVHERKPQRLREQLGAELVAEAAEDVEAATLLTHEQVRSVVAMGPSARHVAPAALEPRLARLPDPVPATLSVRVQTHRLQPA